MQSKVHDKEELLLAKQYSNQSSQINKSTMEENDSPTRSNLWIIASFAASILFTGSAIIRGVMSDTFLTTKGILCIASFTTGLAYIIITKAYRAYIGD